MGLNKGDGLSEIFFYEKEFITFNNRLNERGVGRESRMAAKIAVGYFGW